MANDLATEAGTEGQSPERPVIWSPGSPGSPSSTESIDAEVQRALSRDIHLLGDLLGAAIRRLAGEEAFALVEQDPDLKLPEHTALRDQLLNRWRGRLSLARVG